MWEVGESDGHLADVVHTEFLKALERVNGTLQPRGVTVVHRWRLVDRDRCEAVAGLEWGGAGGGGRPHFLCLDPYYGRIAQGVLVCTIFGSSEDPTLAAAARRHQHYLLPVCPAHRMVPLGVLSFPVADKGPGRPGVRAIPPAFTPWTRRAGAAEWAPATPPPPTPTLGVCGGEDVVLVETNGGVVCASMLALCSGASERSSWRALPSSLFC